MRKIEEKSIKRRDFISGSVVALAGATLMGAVAGCAPSSNETQLSSTASNGADAAEETEKPEAIEPAKVLDCDVVVVGAGSSGVCAAVSASELGAKVILLEAQSETGGNGQFTEGVFVLGSPDQERLGINIDKSEILGMEGVFTNYRVDLCRWTDLIDHALDNYNWLKDNGVLFSGDVTDYKGMGKVFTHHWFEGERAENYMGPMLAKAEANGAQIITSAPATQIIMDSGKVAGIYADSPDGVLQINAKAVILATGGFVQNEEVMANLGFDMSEADYFSTPGHVGDGLKMATEAGARDVSSRAGFLRDITINGLDFKSSVVDAYTMGGPYLWVNGNGERFADENCAVESASCCGNAVLSQESAFCIVSQNVVDDFVSSGKFPNLNEDLQAALSDGVKTVFTGEDIGSLAQAIGVDKDALQATVNQYNSLCEAGKDTDFGKDPEKLTALSDGPFYAFRMGLCYLASFGGVHTNRNFQALAQGDKVIDGLYAVGTDGCELYMNTYTISVPASANANNVNSGRWAAKHAVETYC